MVTATKTNKLTKVLDLLNQGLTVKAIAKKSKCTVGYVYNIKNKYFVAEAYTAATPEAAPTADLVNHPPHYKEGGIETIDFIEAKNLDYHLGNVIKYVSRADHKGNKLQDLQKAQWYLNRAIEKITSPNA